MKDRRKDALAAGDKFYFTGKPCKRGHIVVRHAVDGECSECKKNKPINHERAAANSRAYYKRNTELAKAKARASYAKKNKELAAKALEYREANPDKTRAAKEKWRKKHAHKVLAWNGARRAARRGATPAWLTDQQKLEIEHKYLLAKIHESVTGFKWHVDHIVPLINDAVCGLHVPWNLEVIPAKDNLKKNNRLGE